MKSHLFCTHDFKDNERFIKDLAVLFALDESTLNGLPLYALKSLETYTQIEQGSLVERASKELKAPPAQLNHALDVMQFFLREFAPNGDAESDEPEVLVSDMEELIDLPTKQRSAIISLLSSLRELSADKAQTIILERGHSNLTLPRIKTIAASVDFRAVFDSFYTSKQDAATYSPQLKTFVPLGILDLEFTNGSINIISMQLNRETLQLLISHLLILQKEIAIAEKGISIKEE